MPQMTITAWAKAHDSSPIRQVVSHDDGGYDRSLGIDYRGGGTGWSTFCGSDEVLGYHPVTVDEWVFLAVFYDQYAGTVKLYVNSNIYEGRGTLYSGWNYIRIGSNPSFGEFFSGDIDDVRIYDRALSELEIQELYSGTPNIIELDRFNTVTQNNQITTIWNTLSEIDNAGFNIWRSESKDGKYIKVNSKLIEAEGGATLKVDYSYTDNTAKTGITYYYKLEDIDTRGVSTFHGPVSATIPLSKSNYYYPAYSSEWYPPWPPIYEMNYSVWWPYYPYP